MFNIENILEILSGKRPLFKSERDLQESLLQTIRNMGMKCEANKIINGIKVDLWIEDGDQEIIILLKHKTKKLSVSINGYQYDLKNHGAQDQGRYDFLKDVKSLEALCMENKDRTGYAILLTNDHRYWEKPIKPDSVDKDFQLYGGREVGGTLSWKEGASPGTKYRRENAIGLKGIYELSWKNYSKFVSQDSELRYLCVEVK